MRQEFSVSLFPLCLETNAWKGIRSFYRDLETSLEEYSEDLPGSAKPMGIKVGSVFLLKNWRKVFVTSIRFIALSWLLHLYLPRFFRSCNTKACAQWNTYFYIFFSHLSSTKVPCWINIGLYGVAFPFLLVAIVCYLSWICISIFSWQIIRSKHVLITYGTLHNIISCARPCRPIIDFFIVLIIYLETGRSWCGTASRTIGGRQPSSAAHLSP